ncbi:MAG: DNA polymerase I [Clostridia bacterium]|nr:DNA polymerase I [Clostridia bacterium]
MKKEKFIVIDGNSLANRAFYAIPLLSNSRGVITNAAYGFTNMLMRIFADEKPDYMAVAFDKGRVVFRHQEYAEYKGQRKGMPDELRPQMGIIKDILKAMNVAVFEMEGYEADDLIGTMVKWAEKENLETLIVTGDRDALQLVSENTRVLLTRKGISELEIFDIPAVKEKFGLTPEQIIDLKGLMGDPSDNIPGVPGVGEKTALKLLQEYGSVENIMAHLEDFQGKKLGEKLKENKEQAFLSKKLATIYCCVEMDLSREKVKVVPPDYEALIDIYKELDFNNLLKNILAERKAPVKKLETRGEIIERPARLKEILTGTDIKELSFLLHFDSPDAHRGKVTCLGIWLNDIGYLIQDVKDFGPFFKELKPYLEDEDIPKITYDAKMAHIFFLREKIKLRGVRWDVLLASYLLDPSQNDLSLKNLIYRNFGTVVAEEEPARSLNLLEGMHKLKSVVVQKITAHDLLELYEEVELPLSRVLAHMELQGVKLDREQLKKMGKELEQRINGLTGKIFALAGEEFNINSPKQLGSILFEKLGLPVVKKTKTGYSTDAEVLETLAEQHQIVKEILNYRMLVKLKSTYVDGLLNIMNTKTNKVHTSFNQTITATGRLSSTEPNLQNIPIRLEEGRKIRKAFIPSKEGYILLTADYSQIELRILAHIAQDEVLIEAFGNGQDIHSRTASEIFNVPMEQVTKEMRRHAKAINFGIIYGLSDFGLAKDLGISRKEAKSYIDNYFKKYAGVKRWIEHIIQEAREKGYVTTLLGRRRYLNDINSKNYNLRSFAERTAMNTPIQGSAADIIKIAMVNIFEKMERNGFSARMILQVHDELVFEAPPREASRLISLVRTEMEQAYPLIVPLKVDMQVGFNWYELESIY